MLKIYEYCCAVKKDFFENIYVIRSSNIEQYKECHHSLYFYKNNEKYVSKKKHNKSLHEILNPKEEPKCRIFANKYTNICKYILLHGKCYLESQKNLQEM